MIVIFFKDHSQWLTALMLFLIFFIGCAKREDPVVESDTRGQFLGTYTVTQGCGALNMNENDFVNIDYGKGDASISILGLLTATVSDSSLTLVQTTIDGIVVSGDGSLSRNTLKLNLTLAEGNSNQKCNMTLKKN